jgi:hypothetical protein
MGRRALNEMQKAKRAELVGTIKQVYKQHTVAVLDLPPRLSIALGEELYICSDSHFEPVEVLDIQFDGAPCQAASSLTQVEVGLLVSRAKCRVGSRIERLANPIDALFKPDSYDCGLGI